VIIVRASEFLGEADSVYRLMFIELASRVGMTLEELELEPDGDNWRWPYEKYTWREDEEEDFRKWLVDYVYKNKKKLGMSYMTKKQIREKEVPYWLLQFAWRYENEKNL